MATLEARLIALAQAIGADVKSIKATQGSLSALSTTAKTSLVAAINEVVSMVGSAGASINDTGASASTTFSGTKINTDLTTAINTLRAELKAGAGAALDTFQELATALNNDPSFASTMATALGNRVRFDAAQTLSVPQKLQARQNIDAMGSAELGNPDADLVQTYTTAKA